MGVWTVKMKHLLLLLPLAALLCAGCDQGGSAEKPKVSPEEAKAQGGFKAPPVSGAAAPAPGTAGNANVPKPNSPAVSND